MIEYKSTIGDDKNMSSRVTIWLTDAEMKELELKAESKEVKPWEMGYMVVSLLLGSPPPRKLKRLRAWLDDHELATREEYFANGNNTQKRIQGLIEAAERPLSTTEIRDGLGWKVTGGLTEILREYFDSAPPQKRAKGQKGRTPMYWKVRDAT